MSHTKLCLLLCSGLLACSGRYVSNSSDGTDVAVGAASATGGKSSGKGGQVGSQPPEETLVPSIGGATSTAGSGQVDGPPPQTVSDTACGVALGQPAVIDAPISNGMLWWFRLSKLIWAEQAHSPPPGWADSINGQRAGQLADDAIDQAIAETKGIPGVEPFVRHWLHLQDPTAQLAVDWNSVLREGVALEPLLNLRFRPSQVGAFSEPDFLTVHPSISRRGAVMVEALFALSVPNEPPGVPAFVPPAGLTRREGLAQAVSSAICVSCHHIIDPLGVSLGNYDESGSYITLDAGKPIDTSASYQLPQSGGDLEFKNIEDLARQLTSTCDANLGFADAFLRFALEQSGAQTTVLDAYQVDSARMRQAFMRSGRTYRSLIKAFAQGLAIRAN